MSLAGTLLIHTLKVYRRTETNGVRDTDRFGQELAVNPRQHESDGETLVHTYKCRAYQKSGGLLLNERMVDTFQRYFMVYTEIDVDINEDDALECLGVDGHSLFGLLKIQSSETKYDSRGPHHCEFVCIEQSGPNMAAN